MVSGMLQVPEVYWLLWWTVHTVLLARSAGAMLLADVVLDRARCCWVFAQMSAGAAGARLLCGQCAGCARTVYCIGGALQDTKLLADGAAFTGFVLCVVNVLQDLGVGCNLCWL